MMPAPLATAANRPVRADWLRDLKRQVSQVDPSPEQLQGLRKLQDAAEQFEAMFVKQMLQTMRQSTMGEAPQGMGALAYDFLDDSIAKNATQTGPGFGLARSVFAATGSAYLRTQTVPRQETQGIETHG